MSSPEIPKEYELVPRDRLIRANNALFNELDNHGSSATYLNSIQHLYAQPRINTRSTTAGESVFETEAAPTDAHRLADIARFVTLSSTPEMDTETDSFYRGLLLGAHFMKTAVEDGDPVTEATLHVRKQFIQNTKASGANDRLRRQGEVSTLIMSELEPVEIGRSTTGVYEVLAHEVVGRLGAPMADAYVDNFLKGYRFMLKLYLDPDLFGQIDTTLRDHKHIPEYSQERKDFKEITHDLEAPSLAFQRLDFCKAHLIEEFERTQELYPESALNAETISNHLTKHASEKDFFVPGDLVQVVGTFFYMGEYTDKNGTLRHVEDIETGDDFIIMGTYEEIVATYAPSPKVLKKHLKNPNKSTLDTEQFVPAIRLTHPSVIFTDSRGKQHTSPLKGDFTYTIPLTYPNSSFGRFIFGEITEREHNEQ